MALDENAAIKARIERIRELLSSTPVGYALAAPSLAGPSFEAAALAQSVLHDTVGGHHPHMASLRDALKSPDLHTARAVSQAVVALYDEGGLRSPRLAIAHEIEGDILDTAEKQVQAAEKSTDATRKQLQLAIAAFLAGAALEDALRRLCDASGIEYDPQRAAISNLQSALYRPSQQVEIISKSENSQITAWGATRNKADHGRFGDITYAEVLSMIIGVRGFIDKHLP